MAEIATAYVTLIPSLKGANKAITQQLGGVNVAPAGKKIGASLVKGMGGGLVTVGKIGVGAIAGIGTAIAGIAAAGGISRALKIDQAEMKFKALGLNVTEVMESCNKAVQGTAFGLDAAATVAASLGASGVKAGDEMTNSLKAVAGMASMGGRSMEDVGLIFGKVAAQGRLQGDELMQFAESGINASAALAKHLGVTGAEVQELVKKGKIDFKTFSDAMYEAFGTAAEGANETFQGAMSNARAALSRIGAKFATPALEGLRKVFVALIPAIDGVSKLLDPMVDKFASFTEAVSGRLVTGIEAFSKAMEGGKGVMGAFGAGFTAMLPQSAQNAIVSASNWLKGLINLFNMGKTPAEKFRLVIGMLENTITNITSGDRFGAFLDGIRAKIATLPQPVQNVIGMFQDFGAKVSEAFGNLSLEGLGGVAAIAGAFFLLRNPLSMAAKAIMGFGGAAKGAFNGVIQALIPFKLAFAIAGGGVRGFATAGLGMLKAALGAVISPMGLIIAAGAALAGAFVYLMTTNEGFRNTVMQLVGTIGASLAPILGVIAQTISNLAATVLPVITNAVKLMVPVIGQVITIILQVIAALAPLITTLVSTLLPIISSIMETVVTVAGAIIAAVMPVISSILAAIQAAMPLIQTIITAVMGVVLSIITTVWPAIQSIITTAANAVLGVINFVWPFIQGVIQTVMGIIQTVIGAVMAIIQGDWEGAWNIVKNALSDAWEGIKKGVSDGIDAVMGFISELPGKITGFFADAGTWLVDAGKSILNGLWDGIQSGLGWLGEKLGGIGSFIIEHKGPPEYDARLLTPNGELIMGGLIRGVTNGIPALGKALGTVTDSFGDWSDDMEPFGGINPNVRSFSRAEIVSKYDRDEERSAQMERAIEKLGDRIENMKVVMDSGELVGSTSAKYDRALSRRQLLAERGF